MAQPTGADTIRILVATDNHVGYEERDPIRKDDSWKTFDEILNLARTEDVDMVLLAGDLFHDNKPSRKAMYQVIRTLRQNCLGMKPCELEFLSDATEIFEGAFGHVNYEDPDINVSLPVFSIHGNHDDPSGDGHFCSLDLLQAAGLVNYFGRVPEADNIEVKPVLLQKGRTKLALFGLSNVRDERMFRTFRDHKVKFFRPGQQQSDFFNLLALHQNHHAHTATSYLPEEVLPAWLDLVVWGHEHECLIDPRENPQTGFHVMQPGSSVATSLVQGESVAKHVAVVSITGKDFQVDKIPLKTVRPMVTRDLVLATDKRFKDLARKKEHRSELTRRLEAVVHEMIDQAREDWAAVQDGGDAQEAPLPLIRLRVEFTAPEGGDFDCENPQRFSHRFVGKVANTNDVVYFYRKKKAATRRNQTDQAVPETAHDDGDELHVVRVEALVQEYLAAQRLKVLPQGEFEDAVNQFVNKDDKTAMETFVNETLGNQLQGLLDMNCEEEDLDGGMETIRETREKVFREVLLNSRARRAKPAGPRPDDWDSDFDGSYPNVTDAATDSVSRAAKAPSQAPARGRARQPAAFDDEEDEDMDDVAAPAPAEAPARRGATAKTKSAPAKKAAPKKAAPKKAPAKTRSRKKGPFEDSDEDESELDAFVDDDDEPPAPPPPRAAPKRATGRAKQSTLNFTQSQRPKRAAPKVLEISDDEISEDDAFESAPTTRSSRRK